MANLIHVQHYKVIGYSMRSFASIKHVLYWWDDLILPVRALFYIIPIQYMYYTFYFDRVLYLVFVRGFAPIVARNNKLYPFSHKREHTDPPVKTHDLNHSNNQYQLLNNAFIINRP